MPLRITAEIALIRAASKEQKSIRRTVMTLKNGVLWNRGFATMRGWGWCRAAEHWLSWTSRNAWRHQHPNLTWQTTQKWNRTPLPVVTAPRFFFLLGCSDRGGGVGRRIPRLAGGRHAHNGHGLRWKVSQAARDSATLQAKRVSAAGVVCSLPLQAGEGGRTGRMWRGLAVR